MRVGVTGASGFTGGYLMNELRARGHEAIPIKSNLGSKADLGLEVAASKLEAVIHLAAKAFVHMADYELFYAVNQLGSFNLLAAMAAHSPGARVILASSAQVYGAEASGMIDEMLPVRPANHYALSKMAMEMGSSFWSDRLDITTVRPFNYTGVGQNSQFLIPKMIDHFCRRAPVIELGNIDVERDFGDVRSVVSAYVDLLDKSDSPRILNVCTGVGRSVRTVLAALTDLTGHSPEIQINPDFIRDNEVKFLVGDCSLLRQTLPSWKSIPFEETISWMIEAK